jgi:hypothetical protein
MITDGRLDCRYTRSKVAMCSFFSLLLPCHLRGTCGPPEGVGGGDTGCLRAVAVVGASLTTSTLNSNSACGIAAASSSSLSHCAVMSTSSRGRSFRKKKISKHYLKALTFTFRRPFSAAAASLRICHFSRGTSLCSSSSSSSNSSSSSSSSYSCSGIF